MRKEIETLFKVTLELRSSAGFLTTSLTQTALGDAGSLQSSWISLYVLYREYCAISSAVSFQWSEGQPMDSTCAITEIGKELELIHALD